MKHNFFKFLLVGMVLLGTSINLWAWEYDVHVVPANLWGNDWNDSKICKVLYKTNNGNTQYIKIMDNTGRKWHGMSIYKIKIDNLTDKGVNVLKFQRFEGDVYQAEYDGCPSWWTEEGFSGKIFLGYIDNNHKWISYVCDPEFNYAFIRYNVNSAGSNSEYYFQADQTKSEENLGTITTSFVIKEMYLNFDKHNGNVCGGYLGYGDTHFEPTWDWQAKEGEIQAKSANFEVAKSTDPSGKYTFEFWWKLWGDYVDGSNCDDTWYIANNGKNYKWKYTILPPAVSNFAVSASGYISNLGAGTENDPYLVQYGSTLTLSASGSKEHDDANSSFQVKFGNNDYSATTTHYITVNSTTKTSIVVKGKYRNSTASLDGAESTKTIYYQAVYTGLTAVASPAAAVSSNPTISPTYTSSSVNVGAGTANTDYQFKNWSSSNGNFGSTTTASTTFTPNANSAVATANYQIKVTFDKNGHGGSTPTAQWIDYNGKVTNPGDLSEAGWEFGGWYKESTCTNEWNFSTDVVTVPTILYAKWTQSSVYYIITKGVNDAAMGSITSNAENESHVLSGSTITFTATPYPGYEVVAWYTDATCTEGEHDAERTTYSQVINGNATVYVKFKETKHAVTINKDTGISSVTPSGEQQVGNVNPVGISATVATGYTWSQWTKAGDVTITEPSNISTTIKATGEGTVTATATEKTVTLTPTVNDDNMGSVSAAGTVGIATSLTLTATKKNGYKFDHWELSSNLTIQDSKTTTDNPITVKTNGDGQAVTAQAVFVEDLSTGVYLKGEGSFGGWQAAGFEFMKPTGHSTENDAYVTIPTTSFEEFWMVPFALFDNGKTMVSSNYYFYNSTLEATLAQAPQSYENMKFFSTVAGDYVFHYNLSTKKLSIEYPHENCVAVNHTDSWSIHPLEGNEATINLDGSKSYKFCVIYDGAMYANLNDNITSSQKEIKLYNNFESFNHKIWINTVKGGNYVFNFDHANDDHLTVTYPEESYQTVTVYEDGVTPTEVKVYEVSKPSITAQVPEGMLFDRWTCTGDATVANENDATTTVTNAGTNGTVKATFKTTKHIYLKGGSNFSDAYMNFYKSNYWNNDLGTGNTGSECVAKNWKMNKITNTDIFWLDITSAPSEWKNYFSFVNKGDESDNFYMCNVVYRDDMTEALPFYVPRNSYANEHHNSSQYFNEGIWMKYNSTEAGYDIRGDWDGWAANAHKFVAETPGGYEFKTTITLAAGVTYEFKIYNDNGTNYGATNQTMTATSCTNWKMHLNNGNCQITTSEAGDYTFVLNLGSGEVIISVEYPLSTNDYRVVAKKDSEDKWKGDLIKNSGSTAKKDTTSFFNNNYTYQLQKYAGGGTWNNIGDEVTITDNNAKKGVITLIVTQDGNNNATLAYEGIYTGNYYIRTDGVDGGWGDYKNNSDNKMDNYGSLIDADPDYQYDVYKAKWILSGKNVKFRVANDYSKAISDELRGDDIIGNDKETLPQDANVRFMWNSQTNELKRAYISGSAIDADKFLMLLCENEKMFNLSDESITELKFTDKNNWVYQADIKAQPGCEVRLTAQYNKQTQYFIGSETTTRKIIDGPGDTKYTLRAVYDFKTNRLVAGWIPNGTITDNIVLGSDMLIERIGQGDASQIVFGGAEPSSLSISEIQHIYGVLKLTKTSMLNATETDYAKCIYWISFPFDVKVSEIFGVEKYGEVWAISNYRGDLRAQKGWFKQDTQTFWEFLKPSDIMKANVGYTLNLDPDYFNKDSSEPWKNSATEVAWYFPSIEENIGVVSLAQKDTVLPAQHCTIDREFETEDQRKLSHKFTDSNWRVIGVPAFQNLQSPTFNPVPSDDETGFGLKGFYEWDSEHNTYTARSASEYTFKATGAYMVQYEGKITWSDAAVITTGNKAPWHAPEYTYADAKNYSITLEFGDETYTDQTFVTLIEKASTDFVLNEDMMKIDNSGQPNIYSFAGAYDVAYNETTFDNQTVMLGVSAPKDGSYTFAMPKDFSGKAVLVDLESGEATDLNLSDYTIELNKGTYNNRFQLMLEVEAKTPTAIDNAKGEWSVDGKTKKLFINDNIYLINAGRIYNVLGVGE